MYLLLFSSFFLLLLFYYSTLALKAATVLEENQMEANQSELYAMITGGTQSLGDTQMEKKGDGK